MKEIEEYLLMIFLESIDHLSLYEQLINGDSINMFKADLLNHAADNWNEFKQEELGRTLPEEFELFVSDAHLKCLRHDEFCIAFNKNKNEVQKNKIKITVVKL